MLQCGLLKLKVSCDLILLLPVLTLGFTIVVRTAWMPKIRVWVLSGWVGLAGVLSQEPALPAAPGKGWIEQGAELPFQLGVTGNLLWRAKH